MKKVLKNTLFAIMLTLTATDGFSQQWDGLTLYSNGNATAAYLVDTNNVTIKSWTGLTGGTGYSSYLAPGGTLVRSVKVTNSVFNGGGACGKMQKIDYNGNLTWDYTHSSTTYYTHHDHCVLPNGNVLMIAYELKTQSELTAAGGTNTALTSGIWPEKIIEVQPTGATTGNIVWEWHVWDHLVQNTNSSGANYQSSIVNHPELLNINYQSQKDWMHCNGLDYNPMLDQIALSSHNMNEWYIIDHSTTTAQAASHSGGNSGKGGDFLYRWGNPAAYQATGTKYLNVTHDVHWIPEGHPNAGRLVGFNNQGVSSSQSCVDQVITPYDGNYNYSITPGSAYGPSIYDQRTTGFGYTSNEGSSEQLPNGNTLVCVSISGKIYEITPSGAIIYTITTGSKSSQAHRYSTCYINNTAPSQPTISVSGNDLTSTTASTYQWYYNGNLINGATSQNYTPTQSGIYVVRTTDVNGCVNVYSSGYAYSVTTTINDIETKNISVYPNPTTGIIDIDFNFQNPNSVHVMVYDAFGKIVYENNNIAKVDLTELANGIYTMSISLDNKKPTYKKVVLSK